MQHTDPGADSASQRLYAYTVREFDTAEGKKGRAWTRIGVAFPHKDGTGFNIEVHSFPLDRRRLHRIAMATNAVRADGRSLPATTL
jgi:hypothetical protein